MKGFEDCEFSDKWFAERAHREYQIGSTLRIEMSTLPATSFRGDHWNIYVKDCIESFIKHWPEDTKLYAYYNDWPKRGLQTYDSNRVEFIDLMSASTELCEFFKKFKSPEDTINREQMLNDGHTKSIQYEFFVKTHHVMLVYGSMPIP